MNKFFVLCGLAFLTACSDGPHVLQTTLENEIENFVKIHYGIPAGYECYGEVGPYSEAMVICGHWFWKDIVVDSFHDVYQRFAPNINPEVPAATSWGSDIIVL